MSGHDTLEEALRGAMVDREAAAPTAEEVLDGLDPTGAAVAGRHRHPVAASLAVAAVVAVGAVLLPHWVGSPAASPGLPGGAASASPSPGSVTVPDVHGMTRPDAVRRLTSAGLRVTVRNGGATVVRMSPAAGSRVPAGSTVRVELGGPGTGTAGTLPTCRAENLTVAPGRPVEGGTGEHAVAFAVRNEGPVCALLGAPTVVLRDAAGHPLGLEYRVGGYQVVSSEPATAVEVDPGGAVWFALDRYRCDLGVATTSRTMELSWPGAGTVTVDAVREPECAADGASTDPGNVVHVSTVRATYGGLLRY